MTTLEILTQARGLISNPAHWCQCSLARSSYGGCVNPEDKTAQQWCAIGAVLKVGGIYASKHAKNFLYRAAERMEVVFPSRLNDNGTHADVMAMFDKAIELAQQEGNHAS